MITTDTFVFYEHEGEFIHIADCSISEIQNSRGRLEYLEGYISIQYYGTELAGAAYTNVRTLTRELVDLLIQNIYIYSSTSIEIVWKCGDEYQRLLADTTKKEAAEHEQG